MSVVACCESYLLIGCHEGLILVNPSTRIYRVLPLVYVPSYSDYVRYGMCHCLDDEFNNDFKIVTIFRYDKGHYDNVDIVREVVVFSLSTNSWKTVECKRNGRTWIDDPVLVQNHLLVMILYDGSHYGRKMRIGCFDIKAERWSNDVLLPDILLCEIETNPTQKFLDDYYHLGVLDGRLRFSCYDMNKSTYNIWVMKDYGVKESWVELMTIPRQDVSHPIAYRKGSSHELLCIPKYSGKYLWYNIREKQFIETVIDGDGFDTSDFSFAYICKQSLLNFPGGLPIPSLSKEQEVDHDDDYEEDEEENDEYLLSSCKF
ncbi:F-box protein At4g22390-like [Silene latifolia]|uniref:F-box protein At4g22390-like n=1 Tax=Silene latifolia TaxID=37657 RepID=UPI003D771048